jgi:hypothetical protein
MPATASFSLLRTLVADLPRTRTPWEQVLRTQLARGLSRRLTVSWSRPSRSLPGQPGPHAQAGRRMPFEPGTPALAAVPRLAAGGGRVGLDRRRLLQRFAREIEAITRRLEAASRW